jgi:hypothetical protein
MAAMSPVIPIIASAALTDAAAVVLICIVARPKIWVRLSNAENDFWVRRGVPSKLIDQFRNFEQGRGMKALAGAVIFIGILSTATMLIAVFMPPT